MALAGESLTEEGAFFTVTVTLAALPLWVLTVMVAVPVFLAVITPEELTVATEVLELEKL